MDAGVLQRMRDDHRAVLAATTEMESLFDDPESESSIARLTEMLSMLEHQFATHMEAEDRVLIPALRSFLPEARGALDELTEEHATLRALRADLVAALPVPERRIRRASVLLRDLVDLLRIHIRKEEAVVFHVAEQILTAPQHAEIDVLLSRQKG